MATPNKVSFRSTMLHNLALLAGWLLIAGSLCAQAPKFVGKDPNTTEAEFALLTSIPKELCVGDVVSFTFKGKVNVDGWHLYSSRDDGNISYNPTMLELFPEECKGIKLKGKMTENHKAEEVEDELMGGWVRSFHEKQVDFTQKLEITGPQVVLVGQLSAQTCTEAGMCKFLKLDIEWNTTAKACGTGAVTDPNSDTAVAAKEDTLPAAAGSPSFEFSAYDSTKTLSDNIRLQKLLFPEIAQMRGGEGVCAFAHLGQARSYAAKVGRPLLLHFTSHQSRSVGVDKVFKNPTVDTLLRHRVVMVDLYCDDASKDTQGLLLTNGKPAANLGEYCLDLEKSRFGLIAQPLFALEDENGQTFGSSIGYDPNPANFSKWLTGCIAEYYLAKKRTEAQWLPRTTTTTGNPGAPSPSPEEEDCSLWGLLLTFLKAMGGGFIALLTPCVFPMIPMTVSFFVKQGEGTESKSKGMRNAITYALSIVFIYGFVGFLISTFMPPDTLYKLGSAVVPNAIFFLIFFAFALSFFGLFEIQLPSSWSTAMNNKAGAGGFLGPFFMALTLVIVSFSCTGPILGTAIVQASSGAVCKWTPFLAFLGFGVAFAIPFGFLALFPKLLEKLPQAGGWMNTIKVVFGFLELALCFKFLSNVDLVMHLHILDRQVFLGIWIVIFTLLGAYFLGWILLPHDEKKDHVSVPRLMMAVASFSFVLYLVPGLWGGPLSALEGLIPPTTKNVGVKLLPHQVESGGDGTKTLNKEICETERKYAFIAEDRESHGLCMFYDLPQALEFAKAKNKPLFVDFTGHSCANCRKMENDVWPEDKIMRLLQNEFVTVSLYADESHRFDTPITSPEGKKLRDIGAWVTDYQRRNYGLISQPYYVLMDHDETQLNVPRPYTPDVDTYHTFLLEGIAEFNKRHNITAEPAEVQ